MLCQCWQELEDEEAAWLLLPPDVFVGEGDTATLLALVTLRTWGQIFFEYLCMILLVATSCYDLQFEGKIPPGLKKEKGELKQV